MQKELLLRGYDFNCIKISPIHNLYYNDKQYFTRCVPEILPIDFDHILRNLGDLKYINLIGKNIEDISFLQNINLENTIVLRLDGNCISNLDVLENIICSNLQRLDLDENNIKDFSPILKFKETLRTLYINKNPGDCSILLDHEFPKLELCKVPCISDYYLITKLRKKYNRIILLD